MALAPLCNVTLVCRLSFLHHIAIHQYQGREPADLQNLPLGIRPSKLIPILSGSYFTSKSLIFFANGGGESPIFCKAPIGEPSLTNESVAEVFEGYDLINPTGWGTAGIHKSCGTGTSAGFPHRRRPASAPHPFHIPYIL